MKPDRKSSQRHSIRLKGYNYVQPGTYYVTICTQNRECLFGEIIDGEMILSDSGSMIRTVWDELSVYYPGINSEMLQIMPNHLHGIIEIKNLESDVGATPRGCPDNESRSEGQAQGPAPTTTQPRGVAPTTSLPDAIHRLKTLTTKRYVDGVKNHAWQPFPGKLWQRNYYEHIIRNEKELSRIREYIQSNPQQWENDRENPNMFPKNRLNPPDSPWSA